MTIDEFQAAVAAHKAKHEKRIAELGLAPGITMPELPPLLMVSAKGDGRRFEIVGLFADVHGSSVATAGEPDDVMPEQQRLRLMALRTYWRRGGPPEDETLVLTYERQGRERSFFPVVMHPSELS
jgi:hypothetical protein